MDHLNGERYLIKIALMLILSNILVTIYNLITVLNNKFQEFYLVFISCTDYYCDYTFPDRNVF